MAQNELNKVEINTVKKPAKFQEAAVPEKNSARIVQAHQAKLINHLYILPIITAILFALWWYGRI